jgi:hypothetical protein
MATGAGHTRQISDRLSIVIMMSRHFDSQRFVFERRRNNKRGDVQRFHVYFILCLETYLGSKTKLPFPRRRSDRIVAVEVSHGASRKGRVRNIGGRIGELRGIS